MIVRTSGDLFAGLNGWGTLRAAPAAELSFISTLGIDHFELEHKGENINRTARCFHVTRFALATTLGGSQADLVAFKLMRKLELGSLLDWHNRRTWQPLNLIDISGTPLERRLVPCPYFFSGIAEE
jgi:hypothetical protein